MQRLGISEDATKAIQARADLERKRREFCSEVALLKHKAGTLELWYTMQRLELAVKMVGYEVAGTPDQCPKVGASGEI